MLGITLINPIRHKLVFERRAAGAADLDVDFEYERYEEIIQLDVRPTNAFMARYHP